MAENRDLGRGPPNITSYGCLEMVGSSTLILVRSYFNLWMNFNYPVHAAGKLQAWCRPSQNLTIGMKSYQFNRNNCRNIFFQRGELFFVDSYHHDLKTWVSQHDPMTLPIVYPILWKPLQATFKTGRVFTVAIIKKKFSAAKKHLKSKTALIDGLVHAKPLWPIYTVIWNLHCYTVSWNSVPQIILFYNNWN